MSTNGPPCGPGRPRTHGVSTLKRAVYSLGNRSVDRRTTMGRALAAWRSELLADLGGIENVTTQELALIEEAVKTKLILDWVVGAVPLCALRVTAGGKDAKADSQGPP
jgi:hypothetical protein